MNRKTKESVDGRHANYYSFGAHNRIWLKSKSKEMKFNRFVSTHFVCRFRSLVMMRHLLFMMTERTMKSIWFSRHVWRMWCDITLIEWIIGNIDALITMGCPSNASHFVCAISVARPGLIVSHPNERVGCTMCFRKMKKNWDDQSNLILLFNCLAVGRLLLLPALHSQQFESLSSLRFVYILCVYFRQTPTN